MAATPLPAIVAITRSATVARTREVVVMAATPSSDAVAASPPLMDGIITRSATAAQRQEVVVVAVGVKTGGYQVGGPQLCV